MIESFIIPTEILQRPKKKNIIFEELIIFYSVSTSISIFTEILASISAAKTTIKTMKSIRQKLINKVRAKADPYKIILRILDQPFSTIIREFLANSIDLQRVIQKNYLGKSKSDEEIATIITINITTDISYIY